MNDSGLIAWNDRLALGLPAIDHDHRRLVSLINALAGHKVRGGRHPELLTLFDELRDYAVTHFRAEERLMEEAAVSAAHRDAHHRAHAGFVAYLDQAVPVLAANPDDIIEPLLAFLMKWLVQHIVGLDARMAREIAASERGPAASDPAADELLHSLAAPLTDLVSHNAELLDLNRNLLHQVGEKQRVRSALAASEARHRLAHHVFENMAEAVVVTDMRTRIQSATPAFTRITGYSEEEVRGHSVFALISQRHDRRFYRRMRSELRDSSAWSGEVWCRLRDGKSHPIWQNISALRNEAGEITHYIAVLSDLGEIHRARDTADRLSWRDPLTGLANRALFMRELTRALARNGRDGQHVDLLLIDIDRFKIINEARGLAAGDAVLRSIAECLSGLVHRDDLVARLDSDEFAVLLSRHAGEREAAARTSLAVSERIRDTLRAGVELDGDRVHLEVSIGIALFPEAGRETASEMLRQADLAMREAKSGRGGQTVFFETAMGESARERYELEHALRHAVGEGELRLHLQPQFDEHGREVGAEALVRWQHPQRGLISPQIFIPIAENSDLVGIVDRWVLEQACRLLARLAGEGRPLDIAVNISPRHFRMPGFVDDLRGVLAQTGADPNRLVLEITEGIFIADHEHAAQRMQLLRRMGLRFSLDDFGTGYSSLAYLKRLPIHELKIDKSFIQDLMTDASDAALVEAILAVASHLDLRVVAEGVETAEQAAFLDRSPGVIRQGYFYGRPQPVEEWLARLPR